MIVVEFQVRSKNYNFMCKWINKDNEEYIRYIQGKYVA